MRTFVINLPSAKERLKNIKNQLNYLWIEYEIFPAIYWKNLTKDEIELNYDSLKAKKYLWRNLTLWEIWCALSHAWIWRKILKENIPIAFILEDDAMIHPDTKKIYNSLNINSTKRDYISLNYKTVDIAEVTRYTKYINKNFLKKNLIKYVVHLFWIIAIFLIEHFLILISKIKGCFIIRRWKPSYFMWWYFITHEWAKKLLETYDKIFVPCDLLPEKFWKQVNLKFGVTIPELVKQNDGFFSYIDAIEQRK